MGIINIHILIDPEKKPDPKIQVAPKVSRPLIKKEK